LGLPTTLGTTAWQGPDDTTRFTELLFGALVPAAGEVETTRPLPKELEHWAVVVPACSPLPPRALAACTAVLPVTFGTVTVVVPLDTCRTTWLLTRAGLPAAGVWLTTVVTGLLLDTNATR
jgi:hypothetical protein